MIVVAGTWCPPKSTEHLFPSEVYDGTNGKINLGDLHKKLILWQQQLVLQEKALRRKYPQEMESLLNEANALHIPTIYAITPTYARPVQKAELTRLANTFLHVPNFHWILIEDSAQKTNLVTNFLKNSGISYTHLNVGTPPHYKMESTDPNWLKPRGVLQRNAGLSWLRDNFDPDRQKGVAYFADDDNTYDLQIFEEVTPQLMCDI